MNATTRPPQFGHSARRPLMLVVALGAAMAPGAQNPAGASPGTGDRASPFSKTDVTHSEQGNFGLIGGGSSGLNPEFGEGVSGGGTALSAGECPADWDGDGVLTSVDVSYFFNDYFNDLNSGSINADFNVDRITDSSDAVQFLNAWFLGCW
jgi:hypothetical protein